MKEWEYIRLMNRNYLQVRVEQDAFEDLFQYRMMISGPIKGLLGCRMRELNGVDYLLYDISSMQSISSLYAEKKMDFLAFYQLIHCIETTSKSIKEYLLEEEQLFLYPEFVFQEIETKEYNFVYYPDGSGGCNDSWKRLYEFLLTVADHEDNVLVDIIYQSYECIADGDEFAWVEYLGKKLRQEQEIRNKEINTYQEDNLQQDEVKPLLELGGDCEMQFISAGETGVDRETHKRKVLIKNTKGATIFIILYALVMGVGIYYLYSNYILNLQENVVTWAALVVITALFAFWVFLWIKKRDYDTNEGVMRGIDVCKEGERSSTIYEKAIEEIYTKQDDYGKTIFFESEEIENKLYGIGKKNRRIIQINKFPFTIGKKEDSVDGVLDDASVSRVHARFCQGDDALWVEDLNSTNGTFKNGIMLAPHEKVEVFPEDEIRFGKLQFIYR